MNGLSHRAIAKILGVSHGTIINIEKRAIAKMRAEADRMGWERDDFRDFLRLLETGDARELERRRRRSP